MDPAIKAIILAAGQGTRMRSARPKVLHRIAGIPMLRHVIRLAESLEESQTLVIYGHGGELVRRELFDVNVRWVDQSPQLGTGHAVMQAVPYIADSDTVLILYGDVPLLRTSTIQRLLQGVSPSSIGLLTVYLETPSGYGRIVRDGEERVVRIVEEKDATDAERCIREVNTGIMAMPGGLLKAWLTGLNNENAQGEYYLTDVIAAAVRDRITVNTSQASEVTEVMGVNTRAQLAALERVFQRRQADALMEIGVSFVDPDRFDIRGEIVRCGRDIEIDVNVVLEGSISLADNVRIGANCVIRDCDIGPNVEILPGCVLEGAVIGEGARIGPFARLRPETELGERVHIGNFVEVKKSKIGSGSKINHLSYVGDALIGRDVNIGAGTITCNYDGANKHLTVIEDSVFVGSDTQLVAPVRVGKNATIGAGSTITHDVDPDQLALSRVRQFIVPGWQRPTKKTKG